MSLDRTKLPDLFMSVPEAAQLMGISKPTAYKGAKAGDFPCCRIQHRYIVPVDAFVQWMERGGMEAAS